MPDMMQAVAQTRYGSPEDLELRAVARPVAKDGEVLIKIHAAAVNDWEWGLVRGKPLIIRTFGGLTRPSKLPIIGCDVAGRIEAVGPGVEHLGVGDDVYGDLSGSGFGGFAEYVAAPESSVVRMPRNVSYEEAAAIPHAAGLAHQGLSLGGIDHVKTLLVNGAGGGVGPLAVQLAKMHGVEVTGVDHASKKDFLRSLGFDHVVDYTQEDFTKRGATYDLILDVKTNRSPSAYVRTLAAHGMYVTVGGGTLRLLQILASGTWAPRTKGVQLCVLSLVPNKGLDEITKLVEAGELMPAIDSIYPLSDVAAALQRFGDASQHGKIMLRMP